MTLASQPPVIGTWLLPSSDAAPTRGSHCSGFDVARRSLGQSHRSRSAPHNLHVWNFLARVIMLNPRTLHTRGDFMLRRAVLVAALGALFLLPAHDRIVSAAADNPLQ